jgi:hypothetical protein
MKRLMVNALLNKIEIYEVQLILNDAMGVMADNIDYIVGKYDNISTERQSISIVEYLGSREYNPSTRVGYSTGLVTAMFDVVDEELEEEFNWDEFKKKLEEGTYAVFETCKDAEVVLVTVQEIPVK